MVRPDTIQSKPSSLQIRTSHLEASVLKLTVRCRSNEDVFNFPNAANGERLPGSAKEHPETFMKALNFVHKVKVGFTMHC